MASTSSDSVDRIARVKISKSNNSQAGQELHPPLRRVATKDREPWWGPPHHVVKRNFWINTIFGICLIAFLILGTLFGVIFSIIETHGALASVTGPPPDTLTISSTTFVTPSIFTTLIPSDFTTLVPSMVTISVFVPSDATTLIPSVATAERRDGYVLTEVTAFASATLTGKTSQVTSTVNVIVPTTTTVTVAVYSTTFGGHNHLGDHSDSGIMPTTCGNGAENACMSAEDNTQAVQDISTTSNDLLYGNVTTATIAGTTDGSLTTLTTVTTLPVSAYTSDQATKSYSMLCDVAGISTLAPCSPVPTGFYISGASQQATSFLRPVFRFLSSVPSRITGTEIYQAIRISIKEAWNKRGRLCVNPTIRNIVDNFPTPASVQKVGLDLYTRVFRIAKIIGISPPARFLPGNEGEATLRVVPRQFR